MNHTGVESAQVATGVSPKISSMARAGVAVNGLIAQWMRGLTINSHERLALAHLWEHGPMTMSDLGSRIPLSRGAITALTDRLEALGYVQRTADAHDRRRTLLVLTERPNQLLAGFVATFSEAVASLEQKFSDSEIDAIGRWTDGIREIAHAQAAPLRARSDDELPAGPR